jgi:hypothetical protein
MTVFKMPATFKLTTHPALALWSSHPPEEQKIRVRIPLYNKEKKDVGKEDIWCIFRHFLQPK